MTLEGVKITDEFIRFFWKATLHYEMSGEYYAAGIKVYTLKTITYNGEEYIKALEEIQAALDLYPACKKQADLYHLKMVEDQERGAASKKEAILNNYFAYATIRLQYLEKKGERKLIKPCLEPLIIYAGRSAPRTIELITKYRYTPD